MSRETLIGIRTEFIIEKYNDYSWILAPCQLGRFIPLSERKTINFTQVLDEKVIIFRKFYIFQGKIIIKWQIYMVDF